MNILHERSKWFPIIMMSAICFALPEWFEGEDTVISKQLCYFHFYYLVMSAIVLVEYQTWFIFMLLGVLCYCSLKLQFYRSQVFCRRLVNFWQEFLVLQLATHKNAVGVAVGATLGHTICTSLAVVGGSMLASKISQGTVATIGGLLFLCFSLSSYFYPPL